MKWFCHQTDSLDDDFIQDLIEHHGLEGYGFYFAIIEKIARLWEGEGIPVIRIRPRTIESELRLSPEIARRMLEFCADSGKLIFIHEEGNGKFWNIQCPKLEDYADEYIKRKRARDEKSDPSLKKPDEAIRKLAELKKRYAQHKKGETIKLVDAFVEKVPLTRRNPARVHPKILVRELEYMANFPLDVVDTALYRYLDRQGPEEGRDERYFRGVLRGVMAENRHAATKEARQDDEKRKGGLRKAKDVPF